VALIATRARTSQHPLPLGTFLGVAGLVVLFVGQPLVDWYAQLLRA
jgi:prepilin signal peptidase PulO-like enzyme (type II secretory pathway)